LSVKKQFTIGLDFGIESCKAVLVDVSNGRLAASTEYRYTHGVITNTLPDSNIKLEPGWAIQDPSDYLNALKRAVPKLMRESQVDPEQVIGIGVDFAGSTVIPTTSDGTPLALLDEYKKEPNAWPKIRSHRAAQDQAERLTQLAADRFETFLDRYGGKISAEWFFPKVWETYENASSIYDNADRFIEGCDWIVWQLTGVESRNVCAAGYKGLWSRAEGFPLETFFAAMDPGLANIVEEKMKRDLSPVGQQVGELTEEAARLLRLRPGIPVATGMLENYAAIPATTVVEPGRMVIMLGNANIHIILAEKEYRIPGMCGMVEDGIVPGLLGYEAGQSCCGNQFEWFINNAVPEEYAKEARKRKIDLYQLMEEKAAKLEAGESGLIALDWWNGNRSILVDNDLSGMILGYNLETKPEEIYRALLEATAYGTRKIIETFIASGVPINEIIIAGMSPVQNKLLLKIMASVTRMEIRLAKSEFTAALGSAIYAATAAGEEQGGYATLQEASQKMAQLKKDTYLPDSNDKKVYNRLYSEYTLLHDYFGYGHNNAMKRLKSIRAGILEKKRR
jgi:L-ribulokinase